MANTFIPKGGCLNQSGIQEVVLEISNMHARKIVGKTIVTNRGHLSIIKIPLP